jgi:hypothetical protein
VARVLGSRAWWETRVNQSIIVRYLSSAYVAQAYIIKATSKDFPVMNMKGMLWDRKSTQIIPIARTKDLLSTQSQQGSKYTYPCEVISQLPAESLLHKIIIKERRALLTRLVWFFRVSRQLTIFDCSDSSARYYSKARRTSFWR